MDVLVNNNTVTAIIDGSIYTRTYNDIEIKEIKDLIFKYHLDQSDTNKKNIKDFLSLDKNALEKAKQIEAKVVNIEKDIEQHEREIFLISLEKDKIVNPFPKLIGMKDGSFYLKGFENVFMPDELVKKFIKCKENDEDHNSLINFWKLCLLNPDPAARKGLFKFVQKQNLIVTPKGYVVCYRRLIKLKEVDNQNLISHVFNEAVRLKKQKTSLSKYSIVLENGIPVTLSHTTKKFENFNGEILGTVAELSELYKNRSISGTYTDAHSKTMKIQLGSAVKIPRSECDSNPHQTCSRGLHVGTPSFLSNGGFGSINVIVLVNPAHVVSVPYTDAHKMRVCEYFPCYEIENLEIIKELNDSSITTYEDDYCDYEIDQVEKIIGSKKFDVEKFEDDTLEKLKDSKDKMSKDKEEYLRRKAEVLKYFSSKDEIKEHLTDINKIKELLKSRTK